MTDGIRVKECKKYETCEKRITLILLLVLSLLLTSCSDNPISTKKKIERTAEKVMDAIIDEDDKDLLKFFASDIQDNRKTKTMSEIQEMFDFIDGKIISYDYQQGGGEEKQSYGNIYYYNCRLRFRNVTTDTDNIYTINVDYTYIWDERPECEGICQIEIYRNDDRDNEILIGKIYYDD